MKVSAVFPQVYQTYTLPCDLEHFGWKDLIICWTIDGGQPDRPAATGGSDIVVVQKLYVVGATNINSFLDLTFNTLILFLFPCHSPDRCLRRFCETINPFISRTGLFHACTPIFPCCLNFKVLVLVSHAFIVIFCKCGRIHFCRLKGLINWCGLMHFW